MASKVPAAGYESTSDDEFGEFDESKQRSKGWFARFRSKLRKRTPRWWRGKGPIAQAKDKIKEAMWKPDPNATVQDLKVLARAADEPKGLDKLTETLAQQNFWSPAEGEDFAIAAVAAEIEDPQEQLVKGWVLVKVNERNREQERVVLLTNAAYYTAHYDYDRDQVRRVRRHNLLNYVCVRTGKLVPRGFTLRRDARNPDNQVSGMVVTLKVPGASVLARKLAELRGHEHVLYTRAFRTLASVPRDTQHQVLEEVAWAMYGVANRLSKYWDLDEPSEGDLYRPSGVTNLSLGLRSTVPEAKKQAAASRKQLEESTTSRSGSRRRGGRSGSSIKSSGSGSGA